MRKITYIFLIICILIPNTVVYATSGRISGSSVVSCNGKNYGTHGDDNHWHEAELKGSYWYAVGDSIEYTNPCVTQTNNPPTVTYIYGCTDSKAINYNSKANKSDNSCKYYIYGCMDPKASNYNLNANKDDGSCKYIIYGCTDKNATNYNKDATTDDNTCTYQEKVVNNDKSTTQNDATNDLNDKKEDSSSISGIIGLGIIGSIGGLIYYKKKKH